MTPPSATPLPIRLVFKFVQSILGKEVGFPLRIPTIMDLSILELDETPIFDDNAPDPFEDTSDLLFLPGDPFDIPPDDSKPLVMDPFDAALPLPNASSQSCHSAPPSTSTTPSIPLQPSVAQPSAPSAVSSIPLTAPSSPLQENRPLNGITLGVKAKKKKVMRPHKETEQKSLDKLAQRKLRNKESARRYREKQVARRKQLENYTRTLTQQNRELEMLHERLLRLTCEREVIGEEL